MKKILLLPAFVLFAAALAQDGVKNQHVKARMQLMTQVAMEMKVLGEMVKGITAYDEGAARIAASTLATYAGQMPEMLEQAAMDPKSEAVGTIWVSFPDFTERALPMHHAAKAVEASEED